MLILVHGIFCLQVEIKDDPFKSRASTLRVKIQILYKFERERCSIGLKWFKSTFVGAKLIHCISTTVEALFIVPFEHPTY